MPRQRALWSRRVADFELADEFLPVYSISDAVATVADADREAHLARAARRRPAPATARGADGRDIGALRMLPEIIGHLLHGERPANREIRCGFGSSSIPMYEGGWILLGERAGHEIALGLVGKFWRPVIEFARITSADEFRDFDEPGFAKTVSTCRCARSVRTGRCCPERCGQLPPTSTRAAGSDATGPSASARERTSWSAPCSTPHGARPKATTTGK